MAGSVFLQQLNTFIPGPGDGEGFRGLLPVIEIRVEIGNAQAFGQSLAQGRGAGTRSTENMDSVAVHGFPPMTGSVARGDSVGLRQPLLSICQQRLIQTQVPVAGASATSSSISGAGVNGVPGRKAGFWIAGEACS